MHLSRKRLSTAFLVAAGGLSLMMAAPAHAAGSFAGFAGYWRGTGTITMNDGGQERIACRGTYAVRKDNEAANLHLVWASDSYKVDITSNVTAQGSGFTGQWQEATRQVRGNVTGSFPGPGQIQADLQGTGFGMLFLASVKGNRQSVTVKAQGTDVQGASIVMTR